MQHFLQTSELQKELQLAFPTKKASLQHGPLSPTWAGYLALPLPRRNDSAPARNLQQGTGMEQKDMSCSPRGKMT